MKMIILGQCCCGCTVRTGALIIGVLFAISSVADFFYGLHLVKEVEKEEEEVVTKKGEEDYVKKGEVILGAIFNIIVFAACLSLIFGTVTERLKFILVWLVVYCIYAVFICLLIVQTTITSLLHTEHIEKLWEVPIFIISLVLSAYSLLVVYSHYRNLKDGVTFPPRPPLILAV